MNKKNRIGIDIKNKGRFLSFELDNRMIKKGGKIRVSFDDNGIPKVDLSDWFIEDTRKLKKIRKSSTGIRIEGGCIAFSGETEEVL